jgi:hypothetical protein
MLLDYAGSRWPLLAAHDKSYQIKHRENPIAVMPGRQVPTLNPLPAHPSEGEAYQWGMET